MSDSNNPSNPVHQTEGAAATAATAGKTGPTAPATPGFTTETTISSVGKLKEIAPEVYNKMLEGIAMTICNEMKHHQDNIKKIMRDAEREAEGRG